jgi:hypothetical protein
LYSGERAGVRGDFLSPLQQKKPLTLTLSPEYKGEGTRREVKLDPYNAPRHAHLRWA